MSIFFLQLKARWLLHAVMSLPFCHFDKDVILPESECEYAPAQVVPVDYYLAAS